MRAALFAITAFLLTGCVGKEPPDAPPPIETIRYELTPCEGNCPAVVIEVRSDGRATFEGLRHTAVLGRRDFTVTPAQFAAYRARLAPYRPTGERRLEGPICGDNYLVDLPAIDVRWTGGGRDDRLFIDLGCDPKSHEEMVEVVGNAPEIFNITHWVRGD